MAKVIPPPGTYPPAPEEPPYEAKDTIAFTTKYALLLGGAGATISAIQSTLARQNLGVLGFVTRFGDTTAMAGMQLATRPGDGALTNTRQPL